jgi:hypothetical protein
MMPAFLGAAGKADHQGAATSTHRLAEVTKHEDLDDSILKAKRSVDVHLAKDGARMVCTDCHTATAHEVAGPDYVVPADRREQPRFAGEQMSRMASSACHTDSPHASAVLNRRYRKVAWPLRRHQDCGGRCGMGR